ncbi:MAG: NAD(P)H-hydrate dehydratase [Nanoarchaeota archaeon]|nr:NAD(P)H-hydrate dehydratase [Nanoarchaeota archaeon]
MISIQGVRLLEKYSICFGVSTADLMENAGKGLADYISKTIDGNQQVLFVCFHGNNGGDGLCAARHLSEQGISAYVHFIGDEKKMKAEAKNQWKLLPKEILVDDPDYGSYTLVVDALLGTGTTGKLKEPIAFAVTEMEKAGRLMAVDMPTSKELDVETTITFHDKKPGMTGKIEVVDIGIPDQLNHLVTSMTELKGDRFAHKGQSGRVLVVGGSEHYTGAPFLAASAIAALRSGTDWVEVAAPEKVAWAINCLTPDLVTTKLKGKSINKEQLPEILKIPHDIMLIGNGMGQSDAIPGLLEAAGTKVVDADAVKLADLRKLKHAILTPHRKESEQVLKNSGIKTGILKALSAFERKLLELKPTGEEFKALEKAVKDIQPELGSNVLMIKGPVDLMISEESWKFNVTGHPRLSVAGTGDVLAGLCAGYAANLSLFEAACNAAFMNGRLGERLAEKMGDGFVASDLLEGIRDLHRLA